MYKEGSFLVFLLVALLLFPLLHAEPLTEITGFQVEVAKSTLTIDPGLRVLRSNFAGVTTDFLLLNDSSLENLSSMVLENTTTGKILFTQPVNLSESADENNIVDLDSYVNISLNFTSINLTALPSLNTSAQISLYGIALTTPQILFNGEVCPAAICTFVSYAGSIYTFNVTQMGRFELQEEVETPDSSSSSSSSSSSTSGGGGGGGGGGGARRDKQVNDTQVSSDQNITSKQIPRDQVRVPSLPDSGAGLTKNITFDPARVLVGQAFLQTAFEGRDLTIVWIIIAVVIIILFILFIVWKRRKDDEDDDSKKFYYDVRWR